MRDGMREQKDGYRIEKIVFESLPKMYVTGVLLIPDNLRGRTPAILYTAGSTPAFRREGYQQHNLNLVRNGFIVFAIDPIGQGERIQYYDPATEKSKVSEFDHPALQCFPIGTSYARYYLRDAMRAVDYPQTHPEVDPNRIGMGGLSWGGWQCTIVTGLENRIAVGSLRCGLQCGHPPLVSVDRADRRGAALPGICFGGAGPCRLFRADGAAGVSAHVDDARLQGHSGRAGNVRRIHPVVLSFSSDERAL